MDAKFSIRFQEYPPCYKQKTVIIVSTVTSVAWKPLEKKTIIICRYYGEVLRMTENEGCLPIEYVISKVSPQDLKTPTTSHFKELNVLGFCCAHVQI